MYYFSQRSFDIGQKLIKNMGLYCAARYLRNLGIPLESAIEYLALRKSAMTRVQKYDAAVLVVNAAYDKLERVKFNYVHDFMGVNRAALLAAEKEYRGAQAVFRNSFSKAGQ